MGTKVVVGISDMKVSRNPEEEIVTYSLGSCLGLAIYDPVTGIGGMIHCMLPLSGSDPAKAKTTPFMYTDTGVILLLQTLFEMGVSKKNLIAKAAGCSKILDEKGLFNIGERNYTVMRKILWKNNILITSESIGGAISRTFTLYMAGGRTTIKTAGVETEF